MTIKATTDLFRDNHELDTRVVLIMTRYLRSVYLMQRFTFKLSAVPYHILYRVSRSVL